MELYKNVNGDSNVWKFEIAADAITVQFQDMRCYKYTCVSAGSLNIEEMKKLALQGFGLNAFINRNVKKKYASKW